MTKTSKSPQDLPSRVPITPIRRLLSNLEFTRPFLALGKRNRELTYGPSTEGLSLLATAAEATLAKQPGSISSDNPLEPVSLASTAQNATSDYALPEVSNSQDQRTQRACLAIQQHDQPLDAIVVTTLPRYPFCCHEDLLMMPRNQLVEVAALFNSQLPCTTQINLSEATTDAHIRHCIESLVGIIPHTPRAPRANKSRPIAPKQLEILPSPTSPLAMRLSRRRGLSHISCPSGLLERLEEEDEDDFFTNPRVSKKRKVSEVFAAPIPFSYDRDNMDVDAPARSLTISTSFEMSLSPTDMSLSDLDNAVSSPLQDCGRTFTFDSRPGSLKQNSEFQNPMSRYRSNPGRRSAARDKRAQQICRPMGMLHMNSVSPARCNVERGMRKDIF